MSGLVRTAIGEFRVEDGAKLDTLTAEIMTQSLQPALAAVARLQCVQLNAAQLVEIRNGRPIRIPPPLGVGSRRR